MSISSRSVEGRPVAATARAHGLRALAALTASLLPLGLLLAVVPSSASADSAPTDPATPTTVTSDALPTAQINGVAWTQLVVGSTVFVGGNFTSARPAGSPAGANESARTNLMAYDLTTGVMTSFAPSVNGQVLGLAASADGTRLYAVGEFTSVNGEKRNRIAAFTTATGALDPNFKPSLDYRARAVVVTDSAVFVAGHFNTANNVARTRLAAFVPSNGALLPWNPTAVGGQILAMTQVPNEQAVVVGGQFSTVNGADAYGMAKIDMASGTMLPWAATSVVRNAGADAGIYSLASDASQVYGSGYTFGSGGNFEGTFAADGATGTLAWVNGCRGDTYSVAAAGDVLYSTGHSHDCSAVGGLPQTNPWTFQRAQASTTTPAADGRTNLSGNFRGRRASETLHWLPTLAAGDFTGQTQAAWDVVTSGDYVLLSGEFPSVNGVQQQGLTRFTTSDKAPDTQGPNGYDTLTPTLQAVGAGTVRVSWTAAWDRDNRNLTYEVLRGTTVVGTLRADSSWWSRQTLALVDQSAPPGTTATYRIRVSDAFSNRVTGQTSAADVPSGSPPTTLGYPGAVAADGASSYWRLGETSGSTATNWTSSDALAVSSAQRGTGGALTGDSDLSTTFSGAAGSSASTTTARTSLQTFSLEAWVRTTTNRGGRVAGWSSSATGSSTNADRLVYMTNGGQLVFGVNPGTVRTVSSPAAYNDGGWHHVVATLGTSGMRLYVDGGLVSSRTDTTTTQVYSGYWRVGGDAIATAWPSRPTSGYLAGSVDDVAVYPAVIAQSVVTRHNEIGRGVVPNLAPTARFTSSVGGLVASFDGVTSSDPDGTVASYAWTFGDGTTGTGPTPTRTYASSGTYPVTLVVTDDRGATATTSSSVTVAANVAPTAAFTIGATDLTSTAIGTSSSDADGSVTSWSWSWGDGATSTGPTASHAYAMPGTYTVGLTVTDDDGATGSTTRTTMVTSPPAGGSAFAADTFSRSSSGGFGSAEVGGAWGTTGTASSFSVEGAGRLSVPVGATRTAVLGGVVQSSSDVTARVYLDGAPTGGGTYVSLIGRRVGTSDYRVRVRYLSTGGIAVQLARSVGGSETVISSTTLASLTPAPGQELSLRLQVSGSGTTVLSAKVWVTGSSEPSAWTVTGTDATTGLQSPGGVGVAAYVSGTSTAVVTVTFDDLIARPI